MMRKHSDEPCSSHSKPDDGMLLLSFVPYIRDMSKMELIDFQIEVLATIKIIKEHRAKFLKKFMEQFLHLNHLF